jgi:hypothetical protein
MAEEKQLSVTLELVLARLDLMHDDQRRAIEKLNRLRLVVDAAREEQNALAARLESVLGAGAPRAGRLE